MNQPLGSGATIGSTLKARRESLKMTLNEISSALKVKKGDIIALEQDKTDSITKHLYLIGFIKSYGKILKISDEIIEEKIKDLNIDCNTKNKKHQLLNLEQNNKNSPNKDNIINAILILAMLYLLLISFGQFRSQNLAITDLIIKQLNQAQ